jgi:hypothetical protein
MPRTFSSALLLLVAINFSNCSHKLNPEGSYQRTAVSVDANLKEWSQPLHFGNKSGTIQYSVTNDNEHVYIALLSKDEPTEQKILKMGMTVYFDPEGGESKAISINYPMKNLGGPKADDTGDRSAASTTVNQKSRKQELMLQSSAFAIMGFTHLDNRAYEMNEKHPIDLALKINDDNYLVYEAAVPIKNILGHPFSVNDSKKNFSLGIIIKGLQNGDNSGGVPAVMTGGGRGGRGGMRGGGGNRSMNTASSANRATLLKDDVNWHRFRLADK